MATKEAFSQPHDFRQESEALYALLEGRPAAKLALATQFKAWLIEDVIAHLHLSNHAADLSLRDPEGFQAMLLRARQQSGAANRSPREMAIEDLAGLAGRELLEAWRAGSHELAEHFEAVDPHARVPWAGPDMSARSSITARLMETWAHGQAVYDRLGVVRVDGDRIHNIAVLGVNTFGWTYRNRGLDVPGSVPHIRLDAPSGARWEWNAEVETDLVQGVASEFCQVVTQTRALSDTSLRVEGPIATEWMGMAQCFAGPPEEPPKPGTRFVIPRQSS